MKRANYPYRLILLIILVSMIPWPIAKAITPQSQTISIIDTRDDMFVTEAGVGIDSQLCHILDPNMDIRSFLVFEDIEINYWEPLNNATLRLRTTVNLDFDADSSVTVYGMKYTDLQLEGVLNPSWVISVPLTTAFVNVNTSQFYGQQWHEINVTTIVKELVDSVRWDGNGADGTETGDSIGFIILGDEGSDTRWFIDYFYGVPALAPQLVIHWNHEPPPPSASAPSPYDTWTWEYLNTSRGVDIFTVTDYGIPEFQAFGLEQPPSYEPWYINSTKGRGNETQWGTSAFISSDSGAIDPILALDPWTFIFADNGTARVYWSDDEFQTYKMEDPNTNYNLDPWIGNMGSMTLDQVDRETIHLAYTSPTPAHVGVYNVIYTNFTLDQSTGNLTWAPTYTNITQIGATQQFPTMYCENDGTLHLVYNGPQGTNVDQIWYRRRHINGTWLPQVRLSSSDVAADPHSRPDVVANEDTGVALIAWNFDGTDTYWNVVFPNNTAGPPDRLANTGFNPAMVNDRENDVAQMVYQTSSGQPGLIRFQTKTIDNSTAWSASADVSPGGEKHFFPDIGIVPLNGSIQVIWYNDWDLWVAGNWWNLGDLPVAKKTRITNAQLRFNFIEDEITRVIDDQVYFIDSNGTILGPFDTLDDALIGIEDELGHDPEDPTPPGTAWDTGPGGATGPFTRFRMRLYILIIGFSCFFGPVLFFSWRRPTGYYLLVGALIMIMGIGLMIAVGDI